MPPLTFIHNGKQIAPCVVAKAKVALGLPNNYTGNKKRFSLAYWERALYSVGKANGCSNQQITDAIQEYNRYLKAV